MPVKGGKEMNDMVVVVHRVVHNSIKLILLVYSWVNVKIASCVIKSVHGH